jgi:hypothetical protein
MMNLFHIQSCGIAELDIYRVAPGFIRSMFVRKMSAMQT